MKILLIEDERKTIQFIKKGLEENGYEVDPAEDGVSGRNLAFRNQYNLIITDVILPELNGRELCRELREAKIETPILMLTALGETDDVVEGLDSGADDYLAKPFEFKELLARIRSLTKRQSKRVNETQLRIADLVLDTNRKSVIRAGRKIDLTSKEFSLLEYFLRNQDRVIPRAELSKHVWNVDFDTGTNMVEVYVNYLRKKIDKDFGSKLIHTQFGMGYILKEA
jgi:two-component system copper resistance phosphate regulon response regulator CusR